MGFCVCLCFGMHNFVSILFCNHLHAEKRASCLLLLSFSCLVTVNVLWLFLTMSWVGLQCVIVVCPNHTLDGWLRMGLLPPPREFCRHILSCRELKAESFKRCLHSVLRGVSL